ncbi:hypothetical protein [Pseudomonas abietaniphila]|uniref:Uncharacterized protein n=1 Tax=Pseudomonas abietaniphila TaxID=89065 RepID=A0A1G8TEP1_9PSED|nr:hypothetical protein [Pseudomonas abietaniphila]SDJ39978.1 hypothetical protein SAMN05216605_12856 [Pseudomonas abietaniphila]
MSTPIVKSLIDEQLDDIERKLAVMGFGLPFNELLGLPRETAVCDLTKRLAPIQKGRRIAVRVRS